MKKNILAMIFAAATLSAAPAHATGTVAGATEFTQLFNHFELLTQVTQTAASNAMQVQQYIQQITQTQAQLKALTQLPGQVQQAFRGVTSGDLNALQRIVAGNQALQSASSQVLGTLNADYAAMKALKMTPEAYYKKVITFSDLGVKEQQKQVADNQQRLQELEKRAADLKKMEAEVPNLDSQVKGFQYLGSTATAASQMLNENNALLLQQCQVQNRHDEEAARNLKNGSDAMLDYYKGLQNQKAQAKKDFKI